MQTQTIRCSNCGYLNLGNYRYCAQCGTQLYIGIQPSWFSRHCNWTLILEWLGVPTICIVILVFLDYVGIVKYTSLDTQSSTILTAIFIIITGTLFLLTVSWMLRVKNRSQWNLLYGLLGFIGFIIWLCLANKSNKYQ
jgi:hypothetical protein